MSSGGISRSDWFWQRMEPHFDHRSDGVGLIVDGRMAQGFVRDCVPDELAVWSWTGAVDEQAAKPWTQTQTGLCVDARVLPHNALPPVRVETMWADDYVARLVGDSRPVIRFDWDVYLVGNSLIYKKERCISEDTEPTFFLRLDPVDVNHLPGHRKQYGFDNHDFRFGRYGWRVAETCLARVPLPEYDIATMTTGQYIPDEGQIWQGSFDVVESADDGKAAR